MYNNMTVSDLRKSARNMTSPPASGVEISGANKEQLLAWLAGTDYVEPTTTTIPPTTTTTPPTTTTPTNFNGSASDYLANLQSALQPLIGNIETKQVIDENRIIDLIKEYQPESKRIEVKFLDRPVVDVGVQHKEFPVLLKLVSAGIPAFMAGPSGSGKTHSAEQLARALDLPYEAISVGPMTSKSDLVGFIDAGGTYHETGLIRCVKNGGVFLIDEIDAGNAGVLTILNMVMSNGSMATPEGMIKKHANFYILAGANTYGTGADRQYVGRTQLDEATLKRFFVVEWVIDENLENSISGADDDKSKALVSKMQELRANASRAKLRVSVSPRDTIYGVRLLKSGMSEKAILQGLIFKGLDSSTISKLKGA